MTDIEQSNAIPGRLAAARETAGLTQEQLASKIGVQRAVISKYETGAIEPSVSQLRKLADALDTTIAELLNADDTDEAAPAGVGDKIRFYRKEQNLTQEELADRADVSIFTLRQYERGARLSPRTDQLIKLAQALNVSVDDLLHTSDANEEHSNEIGEQIRSERERRGISQKKLAEIAGVPAITLQQYERGVTKRPRIDQLSKIAQALGLSVDDFLASKPAETRIGDRIRQRRGELGLTQEELASKIGTIKQTVYKYEHGVVSNIPSNRLAEIASALAVPADFLLNGNEPDNEVKMSIGEKIGELALAEGMNLRQLAIKADVPYNTVYALVKRSSNRIEWETLEKIAAALGVSAQDLRGCAEMPEVSDVAHLSVSVSEIGRLLQNGEITVSTSRQTIRITLSAE